MVNELGENNEKNVNNVNNENKEGGEQWTIRLGKHVIYNPSPFRDRDNFRTNTIIAIVFVIGVAYVMFRWPGFFTHLFGGLAVGSMIFCYCLSLYETHLLGKKEKEKLK